MDIQIKGKEGRKGRKERKRLPVGPKGDEEAVQSVTDLNTTGHTCQDPEDESSQPSGYNCSHDPCGVSMRTC